MWLACQQVVSNKGSAGVDGMSVKELSTYLKQNRNKIATALTNGQYLPQPILGVSIPKSNGKKRLLGIPTVIDRLLQQAVSQVIMPKFELEFKAHSYGFRPNRNAHQAVLQAQKNINEGYQHIVDIDLKNFFDEVDHCLVMQLLYRKVKCPFTLRLIRKPVQFEILGFKFVPTYIKGEKGKYQLTVSNKSWKTLKQNLKLITRKTTPCTFAERLGKLKEVLRGWVNYFRMGSIRSKLKELDSWLRNRLRYCIWHDWKKPERKRKNLIRLGIPQGQAYAWSRTRMGGWAVAQSPILVTTITLKRLMKRGYISLLSYYEQVAPHLNEPLYTRPVRTVV